MKIKDLEETKIIKSCKKDVVPEAGVEPARGRPLGILSPVRLPVPPLGLFGLDNLLIKIYTGISRRTKNFYQISKGVSTEGASLHTPGPMRQENKDKEKRHRRVTFEKNPHSRLWGIL